jgi:hypothetical protein
MDGTTYDLRRSFATVLAHAETDESMTPSARLVLEELSDTAAERGCSVTLAGRRWLAERTGLNEKSVRLALDRLAALGYTRRLTGNEAALWIDAQLRQGQHGRPPVVVQLATEPPTGVAKRAKSPEGQKGHRSRALKIEGQKGQESEGPKTPSDELGRVEMGGGFEASGSPRSNENGRDRRERIALEQGKAVRLACFTCGSTDGQDVGVVRIGDAQGSRLFERQRQHLRAVEGEAFTYTFAEPDPRGGLRVSGCDEHPTWVEAAS